MNRRLIMSQIINGWNYRKKEKSIGKSIANSIIVFGSFFACIAIVILAARLISKSNQPDDVKWYRASVSELIAVEEKVKVRKSSSKRKHYETVYDCDVFLEYEIDGATYTTRYSINDSSYKISGGQEFYVQVSPSNPSKIYMISTEPSETAINVVVIVFGVIGVLIILLGIKIKKSVLKKKVEDLYLDHSQGYMPSDMNNNVDYSGNVLGSYNVNYNGNYAENYKSTVDYGNGYNVNAYDNIYGNSDYNVNAYDNIYGNSDYKGNSCSGTSIN